MSETNNNGDIFRKDVEVTFSEPILLRQANLGLITFPAATQVDVCDVNITVDGSDIAHTVLFKDSGATHLMSYSFGSGVELAIGDKLELSVRARSIGPDGGCEVLGFFFYDVIP